MEFDDVLSGIGGFGWHQRRLLAVIMVGTLMIALHTLSPAFIAYTPPHHCKQPDAQDINNCTHDTTQLHTRDACVTPDWSAMTSSHTDVTVQPDGVESRDLCELVAATAGNFSSTIPTTRCTQWQYDRTSMADTIVTQFNLVCGKGYLKSTASSVFFLFQAIGYIMFGPLTDRFGRRKTLLVGNTLMLVFGVVAAFSVNMLMFLITRAGLGLSSAAEMSASMITVFEHVSKEHRVLAGVFLSLCWIFASQSLVLIAYLSRDWQTIQLVICSGSLVALILKATIVSETPRWLLVQNREHEAKQLLHNMAKLNGREFSDTNQIVIRETNRESIVKLFKKPSFVYVSIIMYISWFTSGICTYALVFGAPSIGSNPFMSMSLSSVFDIPCKISVYFLFSYIGRVVPLSALNIVAGLLFFAMIFSLESYWAQMILVMLTKGLIVGGYTAVAIYTGEIYPTSVRSTATGIALTVTRAACSLATYVLLMSEIYVYLPYIFLGCLAMTSGLLTLTLPETKGVNMTQTINEGVAFVRSATFGLCRKGRRQCNDAKHAAETPAMQKMLDNR